MIHKSTLAITAITSKNYNFVTEICIKCDRGDSIKFKKKETIKLCNLPLLNVSKDCKFSPGRKYYAILQYWKSEPQTKRSKRDHLFCQKHFWAGHPAQIVWASKLYCHKSRVEGWSPAAGPCFSKLIFFFFFIFFFSLGRPSWWQWQLWHAIVCVWEFFFFFWVMRYNLFFAQKRLLPFCGVTWVLYNKAFCHQIRYLKSHLTSNKNLLGNPKT